MKIWPFLVAAPIVVGAAGLIATRAYFTTVTVPAVAPQTTVPVAPINMTSPPRSIIENAQPVLPPLEPPTLKSEGKAPSKAVLRLWATPNSKTKYRDWVSFHIPELGKGVRFQVDSIERITAVSPANFTTSARYENFKPLADTAFISDAMKREYSNSKLSWIYTNSGKLVAQRSATDALSYNFPTGPVAAGASWQGFQAKSTGNVSVTFTLEKILRHQGRNLAVIRRDHKLPSSDGGMQWFDIDKGRIYQSWSYSIEKENGVLLEQRILSKEIA